MPNLFCTQLRIRTTTLSYFLGILLVSILLFRLCGESTIAGWFTDRRVTFCWIQGDWQVGEYRSCQLLLPTSRLFCATWENDHHGGSLSAFITAADNADFTAALNAAMTQSNEEAWTALAKYFHALPVVFHGRIHGPEHDRSLLLWICQRNDDYLNCKAVE